MSGQGTHCCKESRGVPIPALYKVEGEQHEATMDAKIIQHIIDVVKHRGIDAWWTDAPDEPAWIPKGLPGTYIRGRDTMDVWFDSGTSWTLLPHSSDQNVADVYLEGTDQHRGWFQSSLLTHVSTQDFNSGQVKAPYKTLITHGFTLDSDGRKMSKSLGNVISPLQIMSGELLPPIKRKKQKGLKQTHPQNSSPTYDGMGADALRLWAASSDYTKDVTIGQPVLLSVNQALHKYRVTFKWLLGILSFPNCPLTFSSLSNLSAASLAQSPSMSLTDHLALHRLNQVTNEVHSCYAKYEFFKGVNVVNKYINSDLSAFYFETLKDRIYAGTTADCQHLQDILGLIFYSLLQMLAPVCPLLVEETWDHLPEVLRKSAHPARATWIPPQVTSLGTRQVQNSEVWQDTYLGHISTISSAIQSAQEALRAEKKLGSSLECRGILGVPKLPSSSHSLLASLLGGIIPNGDPKHTTDLSTLFVVSGVEVQDHSLVEQKISRR